MSLIILVDNFNVYKKNPSLLSLFLPKASFAAILQAPNLAFSPCSSPKWECNAADNDASSKACDHYLNYRMET